MKKKIGIVGLGIMGGGMANNFLEKGYQVYVWNRTASVATDFESRGAITCNTPASVAQNADIVFEVTANDESSRSVWLGEQGVLSGASKETILIASATLSIKWIDELIQVCQKSRLSFFDMALTGGRAGAETGNLILLCGGNEALLETIKPDLSAIAMKVNHFGPAGQGMRYKLILNFIQATHLVAFGQAMKIAKIHDMNLKNVGEALVERPGGVVTTFAWRDYQVEPDLVNFSVEWITKDLTYAKEFIGDLDIKLIDEVLQMYKTAQKMGFSKKDWTIVNKAS